MFMFTFFIFVYLNLVIHKAVDNVDNSVESLFSKLSFMALYTYIIVTLFMVTLLVL